VRIGFGCDLSRLRRPERIFRGQCACEGVESGVCKSLHKFCLNLLTESNCVVARRGGEQPEVNDQSVGERTRFGLTVVASLLASGEAQNAVRIRHTGRTREKAVGLGRKQTDPRTLWGGWRRNGRKVQRIKQGDPPKVSRSVTRQQPHVRGGARVAIASVEVRVSI